MRPRALPDSFRREGGSTEVGDEDGEGRRSGYRRSRPPVVQPNSPYTTSIRIKTDPEIRECRSGQKEDRVSQSLPEERYTETQRWEEKSQTVLGVSLGSEWKGIGSGRMAEEGGGPS